MNREDNSTLLQDRKYPYGYGANTTGFGASMTSYEDLPGTPRDNASVEYKTLKARASLADETHKSNTKAVLQALKGLQQKIKQLELERVDAERNLKSIAVETDEYKEILKREQSSSQANHSAVEHHNKELEKQLSAAGERCNILEKQLEYMRGLVRPMDKVMMSGKNSVPNNQLAAVVMGTDGTAKLAELQRDHVKFTASQTLAESKIRELEEKIKEERHQRKILQDKAANLQNVAETNRLLLSLGTTQQPGVISKRKKKVKVKCKSTDSPAFIKQPHCKVDFSSIPFVVGQSTTKSHALGANIQNLLSLMKAHNPHLCTAGRKTQQKHPTRSSLAQTQSSDSLLDLLTGLQDEFGHLGFEHREIAKQIEDTTERTLRDDLERELEKVVAKMEAKGQQIALVKHHQRTISSQSETDGRKTTQLRNRRSLSVKGSDLEVVTTVRNKRMTKSASEPRNQPVDCAATHVRTLSNPNYNVLRKVQHLQQTLRQDDLSWD